MQVRKLKYTALRAEVRNQPKGDLQARLRALGFRRYSAYLATEHWQAFRRRIIRERGMCQKCHRTYRPLHVHHRTYERLGCELDLDVIALCNVCHRRIHRNRKWGKNPPIAPIVNPEPFVVTERAKQEMANMLPPWIE